MGNSHDSLLIRVARLYYEGGLNQNEIAAGLNISRPYVSKLLIEARQNGVVSISIRDPMNSENRLERAIRKRFDMKKVIAVQCQLAEDTAAAVARRAAEWLNTIVKDGDTIALGWGRTMFLMAQSLKRRTDLNDISVTSLYGMQQIMRENVYNIEGLLQMTDAFNAGVCYVLAMPAIMSNETLKQELYKEQSVARVIDAVRRANIAAFTVGVPRFSSYLGQDGGLTREEYGGILQKGASSEICLHLLDSRGQIVDEEIERRMVTMPLEDLKQKEYRIAVAAGRQKTDAVYSALLSGGPNVLVTDEEIAREIAARITNG